MTRAVLTESEILRRAPAIGGRPPYLSGEAVGPARLSTAAREEVRLAREELARWEDAFDRNSGDPDEYRKEIRIAEQRLRSAFAPADGRRRGESAAQPLVARWVVR